MSIFRAKGLNDLKNCPLPPAVCQRPSTAHLWTGYTHTHTHTHTHNAVKIKLRPIVMSSNAEVWRKSLGFLNKYWAATGKKTAATVVKCAVFCWFLVGRSAFQTSPRSPTVLLTEVFVFSSVSPNEAFRQSTATFCCVFGSFMSTAVPLTYPWQQPASY